MLKVCQRPELIQQLQHSLNFADDATVNNALLVKYSLWDYLTPCDADNVNILNACIQRWREEANKLYETTLFSYNPIENYDMEEKAKDKRTPDLTDETTYGGTNTYSEAGYDVPRTLYDKSKNAAGGKDTTTKKGTETKDHELRRHGNIGVTTTQQMIEMERKIILDTLSWYVDKFKECFTVSMSISDYDCCEMDIPVCGPGRTDNELEGIKDDIRHLNTEVGLLQEGEAALDGRVDTLEGSVNDLGGRVDDLEDCCETVQDDITTINNTLLEKAPLMFKSIRGNNIHIPDAATAPVIGCVIKIDADQSGSGTPSPSNPRLINGTSICMIQVDGDGGGTYYYNTDWTTPAGVIYGGVFDIDSGVLVVNYKMIDMGLQSWQYSSLSVDGKQIYVYTGATDRKVVDASPAMCEIYAFIGNKSLADLNTDLNNLEWALRSDNPANYNIYIRDDSYVADTAAFQASLLGYKMIYELATPVVYNVTAVRPNLVGAGCTISVVNQGVSEILAGQYLTDSYQALMRLLSY